MDFFPKFTVIILNSLIPQGFGGAKFGVPIIGLGVLTPGEPGVPFGEVKLRFPLFHHPFLGEASTLGKPPLCWFNRGGFFLGAPFLGAPWRF